MRKERRHKKLIGWRSDDVNDIIARLPEDKMSEREYSAFTEATSTGKMTFDFNISSSL